MANFIQLTDIATAAFATPAVTLMANGDRLFVGPDAELTTTENSSPVVFLVTGNNDVTLQGTLFSGADSGIRGGFVGGSRIDIAAGALIGARLDGIELDGGGNEVFNAGEILAGFDGISLVGADAKVVNTGTIRAVGEGVEVGAAAAITNLGLILGDDAGVEFGGGNGVLDNAGHIAGTAAGGVGVRLIGDDHSLVNGGTIAGLGAAAIVIEAGTDQGLNTIVNTGTIQGTANAFAIIAGDGIERITNAGTIIGSVVLGGGADLYDGREGLLLDGVVQGGAGEDILLGGAAADQLGGGTEDDEIEGGGGDDIVEGGAGGDFLSGGEGRDLLVYTRSGEGVNVNLGNGSTLGGEATGDVIAGFEDVSGSAFDDALTGSRGENRLHGERGNDLLDGGRDNDRLGGGAGDDILIGGASADVLRGGGGGDTFLFANLNDSTVDPSGRDRIRDFIQAEVDRIDLTRLDAVSGLPGNQAFDFIGFAAFSNTAGELRMQQSGGQTQVFGDIDGDTVADFAILLRGTINLLETDFVL